MRSGTLICVFLLVISCHRSTELLWRKNGFNNVPSSGQIRISRSIPDDNCIWTELKKENQKLRSIINLGYIRLSNGYHYKLYENHLTYQAAKQQCEEDGGRLVSTEMRDPTVRGEIIALMHPSNVEATWIDNDDLELDEEIFSLGETERLLSEEDEQCNELRIVDESINVISCTTFRDFVCKIAF